MFDIRELPGAWDTYYELIDEEGRKYQELYDVYYEISTAIFKYRIKHGLSQKKLAGKLGVTQAMVSKLESGDYNYTVEQLWKIANKLGLKFNISFDDENADLTVDNTAVESNENILHYPKTVVG